MTDNGFKYLSQDFNGEKLNLVKQKGVYPHEYMNNFEKLSEDELPDRCEFYSSLKDESINKKDVSISKKSECIHEKNEHISGKDYLHAVNVWNEIKMNTVDDYHDLYSKADVLLLTDVFEKYINTCLVYYGLDPCYYFSSPGLS